MLHEHRGVVARRRSLHSVAGAARPISGISPRGGRARCAAPATQPSMCSKDSWSSSVPAVARPLQKRSIGARGTFCRGGCSSGSAPGSPSSMTGNGAQFGPSTRFQRVGGTTSSEASTISGSPASPPTRGRARRSPCSRRSAAITEIDSNHRQLRVPIAHSCHGKGTHA